MSMPDIADITPELVQSIAKTARLQLTDAEVAEFTKDFQSILSTFSQIDEVDVKNTAPSFQPIPLKNALREDVPQDCLTQEQALSCTPHKKDGYFKGPRSV